MHNFGHAQFLILALMIDFVFSQTFSMVLPIYSVVSISHRVNLTENIGMDWFCIVSVFQLDTLAACDQLCCFEIRYDKRDYPAESNQ